MTRCQPALRRAHRSGQWAGKRLDRSSFTRAVRTYYRMMGWDDQGRPQRETMLDHHLEWAH